MRQLQAVSATGGLSVTTSPVPEVRIRLLAIPEAYMSSLAGFYDTFRVASELGEGRVEFAVEIVGKTDKLDSRASSMPIAPHRTLDQTEDSDVVIVPTTVANGADWMAGSYPLETSWLGESYRRGSLVCSACSGALLLAEAGLLDGQEITTPRDLAATFRDNIPSVRLCLGHQLVASGPDGRIITSGATAARPGAMRGPRGWWRPTSSATPPASTCWWCPRAARPARQAAPRAALPGAPARPAARRLPRAAASAPPARAAARALPRAAAPRARPPPASAARLSACGAVGILPHQAGSALDL